MNEKKWYYEGQRVYISFYIGGQRYNEELIIPQSRSYTDVELEQIIINQFKNAPIDVGPITHKAW